MSVQIARLRLHGLRAIKIGVTNVGGTTVTSAGCAASATSAASISLVAAKGMAANVGSACLSISAGVMYLLNHEIKKKHEIIHQTEYTI